jgi:hypothetical protein
VRSSIAHMQLLHQLTCEPWGCPWRGTKADLGTSRIALRETSQTLPLWWTSSE